MTLIDTLESRRLMSVSLDPATHVLTVNGTDADDKIVVTLENSKLKVNDNGVVKTFDPAKVSKIKVYAKFGNDLIDVSTAVKKETVLDSGVSGYYAGDAGIDVVRGGGGKDTIYCSSTFAQIDGRGGDDTINLLTGFNTAKGGAGNDKFVITAMNNTVSGGDGTDTADFNQVSKGLVIRNGLSGEYDPATVNPLSPFSVPAIKAGQAMTVGGIENFTGGNGNDYIVGTAGRNILRGRAGNDVIAGMEGNDELYGGAGIDRLAGGSGEDAVFGEDGDDWLYGTDSTKDYLSGGNGSDKGYYDASDIVTGVETKL